jgi:hypothetical protein
MDTPSREDKAEIEATPEMIEAGFDALARSGVAEHLCEGDKFVIRNIFNASTASALRARGRIWRRSGKYGILALR